MNEQLDVAKSPVRDAVTVPRRGSFSLLRWGHDADKPLLLFSHATGFNGLTYRRILEPLADRFRVIALDLRGHGLSTAPKALSNLKGWDTYMDDLVAILDLLNEPVIMSGHSMGGTVSMMAAAQRPDLAAGLVLVEPVLIPSSVAKLMAFRSFIRWPITSPLSIAAARRRSEFVSRKAMFEAYQGRGAFTTWPDEMIIDYIEGGTEVLDDGRIVLSCAPAWESKTFTMNNHMVWRRMGQVKCPTIVLFADMDSTVRGDSLDVMKKIQPDWKVQRVAGASHFLPMEFPELVRQSIINIADN